MHKKIDKANRVTFPQQIICFDTEANIHLTERGQLHTYKMGCASLIARLPGNLYTEPEYYFFDDPDQIIQWITAKAKPNINTWVIAHNVFYDLQLTGFFHYWTENGWIRDFWYEKGLTYILKITKGNKSLTCISSTNYFPFALGSLGKLLNLPKLDVDFDSSSWEDLKVYCQRDTEILTRTMINYIQFVRENNLGKLSMTQASQAFNAFRHRFICNPILLHDNPDVYSMEQAAYMGGRVECFQVGKIKQKPVYTLDVNSMYPFVMSNQEYPVELVRYNKEPDPETVKMFLGEFLITAKITVNTEEPCYSLRHEGKLIFPIGTFDCYVQTRGLQYAMQNGHLVKIHEIAYYRKEYIFKDYVAFFYDLKQKASEENNRIMRHNAKLFLNALYGKFAQEILIEEGLNTEITDKYIRFVYTDLDEQRTYTVTNLLNKITMSWGEKKPDKTMISIASHVTENARFHLWELIKTAGRENVFYCDTDCVKVNQSGFDNLQHLIDDSKLGFLGLENTADNVIIFGCKDYIEDKQVKCKGIPKSAKKIDDNTYLYQSFLRQIGHLQKKQDTGVILHDVIKRLNRKYDKGNVDKKGKVTPFELPWTIG